MKELLSSVVLIFFISMAFSQNKDLTPLIADGKLPLNKKWELTLSKAEDYQYYKVIKKTELTELWKVVEDSLRRLNESLYQQKIKIKQQDNQLLQLQQQVNDTKTMLEKMNNEKDNISFLGASVNKNTYVNILWIVMLLVVIVAGIIFFMYYGSNKITMQKKSEHDQLFKSFEEYKLARIEVERKLRRELQTYMNKIEDLKGKQGRI
jgi:hypothetical protein